LVKRVGYLEPNRLKLKGSTMHATNSKPVQPNDGTRQLLQWGASILGTGLLAALLLVTALADSRPPAPAPTPAGSPSSSP